MNLRTLGIFAVGLVGLSLAAYGVFSLGSAPVTQDTRTAVNDAQDGKYGAVVGPDSFFNYYNNNGVFSFNRVRALTAATTTPCVIKSPAATTTLEEFTFHVTAGTSTAPNLTLATSTVPNATTSLIFNKTYQANSQFTMNWHPGTESGLISPNTYVNVGAAGVPYGFTLGGVCTATFRRVF